MQTWTSKETPNRFCGMFFVDPWEAFTSSNAFVSHKVDVHLMNEEKPTRSKRMIAWTSLNDPITSLRNIECFWWPVSAKWARLSLKIKTRYKFYVYFYIRVEVARWEGQSGWADPCPPFIRLITFQRKINPVTITINKILH